METQEAIRAQQERYQEMLRRKKKQREQAGETCRIPASRTSTGSAEYGDVK
ncbi:hypothetical protein [Selenomonas ruminantium]|uniref:hypothetical protein n=1 Tax=Selenomonas ruminantium TaxID=971 RepID=UPI000A7BE25B|nr:hypothetical protein [Selenomonas ruminantium]